MAVELRSLYRAQRSVAETLQRSLLPQQLPALPGIEIAVRYLPGIAGIDVGGDWYDVIRLDDQRELFAVGDVSGRGLEAAALMSSIRNAVRAYAADGSPPEEVLVKVSRLLSTAHDERFATMLCWTVDLHTGELVVANAGHPEPLMMADGRTRFLPTDPGPPLGVGDVYVANRYLLPPGSTLLAYTDGLIERRGESLDTGLARLRHALVPNASLEEVLDNVIGEMVPDGSHDDIAILGVHRARR
jgi:serine phosphatase RsbU (regulator of sigma subunit)